jgi:hypothetical protein
MHGGPKERLLADLDCNGWPQTGRRLALEAIRRVGAVHLCGDQHLAVVVKHGITEQRDGPYSFTSPALVNTIYGRWWHPEDEKPGQHAVQGSPLPWTGDYTDGLGNMMHLMAYANPDDVKDEKKRADGYGIVRINKARRVVTFECWPRFSDAKAGDKAQFPGWPITVDMNDNDGRTAKAWLPKLVFPKDVHPVVKVVSDATGEVISCIRVSGPMYQPPVYANGKYTIFVGRDQPDGVTFDKIDAVMKPQDATSITVKLST